MRRTVLSTFLFVAILGLGCMGVAVPATYAIASEQDCVNELRQVQKNNDLNNDSAYILEKNILSSGSKNIEQLCGLIIKNELDSNGIFPF